MNKTPKYAVGTKVVAAHDILLHGKVIKLGTIGYVCKPGERLTEVLRSSLDDAVCLKFPGVRSFVGGEEEVKEAPSPEIANTIYEKTIAKLERRHLEVPESYRRRVAELAYEGSNALDGSETEQNEFHDKLAALVSDICCAAGYTDPEDE